MQSRRRTISGPVTGYTDSNNRPNNNQDGDATTRAYMAQPNMETRIVEEAAPLKQAPVRQAPEPRPRSMLSHLDGGVPSLPQEEWSRMDATATLRRPRPPHYSDDERFQLTETSTIRRRPKALATPHGNDAENGLGSSHKRPVSEACGGEGFVEGELRPDDFRRVLKPPVSPKPSLALRKQDPPTPTRRVPLPGPEGQHSPGNLRFPVWLLPCLKPVLDRLPDPVQIPESSPASQLLPGALNTYMAPSLPLIIWSIIPSSTCQMFSLGSLMQIFFLSACIFVLVMASQKRIH